MAKVTITIEDVNEWGDVKVEAAFECDGKRTFIRSHDKRNAEALAIGMVGAIIGKTHTEERSNFVGNSVVWELRAKPKKESIYEEE